MKIKPLCIALFFLPVFLSNTVEHEYYVSVTEVGYSEEEKALQIITQIFIDDFEKLMRQRYDESITLAIEDESSMVDVYINRYLSDKLKIEVNKKEVTYNFIGKEYKDDIAYCYLEVKGVSGIRSIKVTNQSLFDIFPEQQNIVRLKLKDKNKSFLLVPTKDSCVLNFD